MTMMMKTEEHLGRPEARGSQPVSHTGMEKQRVLAGIKDDG